MSNKQNQTAEQETDFLEESAGIGFEGIRANDYAMPFLRVIQPTSPELIEGDPAYVPGAKAGAFYNTLTRKVYGAEIEVIPVKSEAIWLEYEPAQGNMRGKFKGKHAVNAMAVEGNVYDGLFRVDNGNEIHETVVFYCLVKGAENELPVVFSLSASMVKHAKTWNALIYSVRTPSGKQAPYFSGYWKLSLVLNQNEKGRWYNIGSKTAAVDFTGFVTKETFLIAAKTRELLESNALNADLSQLEGASERKAIEGRTPEVTEY